MYLERKFSHRDITVNYEQAQLILENATLRRVLDLSSGYPRTVSLCSLPEEGRQVVEAGPDGDFSFIGFNPPGDEAATDYQLESVDVVVRSGDYLDGERVEVELVIAEAIQRLRFRRVYVLYPGLPALSVSTAIAAETIPCMYWSHRDGLNRGKPVERLESCADKLVLAEGFKPFRAVEFQGRTDYGNDIIRENMVTDDGMFRGNLLQVAAENGDGLWILQEAPPSGERRDFEDYDFRLTGPTVCSCCWGIHPQEVAPDRELRSYRHTVILFRDGDDGAAAALKAYLAIRFPFNSTRYGSVMVNPWGCGKFQQLVSEQFLIAEMRAAGKLQATHYQIDDGWQVGRALRELERNNRHPGQEFWQINHELLPNGFEPVVEAARKAGVEPALWVAPSCHCEYRDWEYFADWLYDFHRRYGFRFYKVDFIRTRSKAAEDNLEKLLGELRRRSNGDIYFNLDTTNGQRPGYFLFLEYGNIFLENRYACHQWGQVYHPELVLRNFWRLSCYCRAQMFQIEFTDPDNINYDYFRKKGINPPDEYEVVYWAGVTMFANPLAWLAPSLLKPETAVAIADVMRLHRRYSTEIFAGEIYPIGAEPSGRAWTGFQSHRPDENAGMVIIFREKAANEQGIVELKFLEEQKTYRLTELNNRGETPAGKISGGKMNITLLPGTWKMFRYQPML